MVSVTVTVCPGCRGRRRSGVEVEVEVAVVAVAVAARHLQHRILGRDREDALVDDHVLFELDRGGLACGGRCGE